MDIKRNELTPAAGLETEVLARFQNGGQVEVASLACREFYVGEIQYAVIEGEQLRIGFNWVLKGEGYPPFPKRLVRDESRNSYIIDLKDCLVADLGPYEERGGSKIWIQHRPENSPTKTESLIFYPPDAKKFNSARIKELLATPVEIHAEGPPICRVSGARACN